MEFQIDKQYVTTILQEMVQIDSSNPTLDEKNAGEGQIAGYIAQKLEDLGIDFVIQDVVPGRPNVVGIIPGSGGGRSLMFNGHMDTVGIEGMADPFSAEIRDGRLYGRGAQDMKGSLAAMIGSAKALRDAGVTLAGDLLLAFVIDEEAYSAGSAALVEEFVTDGGIVTEPTDLSLTRAHRGFIWYEVETIGRAAHGSRYNEGIDAIIRMGRFLHELEKLEQGLLSRAPHPLAGPPSLHASKIQGGTELSVYAAKCLLNVERRTIPGETVDTCGPELQAIIDQLAAEDETFKANLSTIFSRAPFQVAEDAAVVKAIEQAAFNRMGQGPAHTGQTFWTDAAILSAAGMETALIGPKGAGLHSAEEWVDLQSVFDLAHILVETAVNYCK